MLTPFVATTVIWKAKEAERRIRVNRMAKRKHSALGKRLIASAKEMVAHAKGELRLEAGTRATDPRAGD